MTRASIDITRNKKAKAYFGRGYKGHKATVDIPTTGTWQPVESTRQILYQRTGLDRRNFYHAWASHGGNQKIVVLERNGNVYRCIFDEACLLNDRGFIKP